MDRRELLKMIGLATGSVVIGGELFLTGCKISDKPAAGFTADTIALLDEVGEIIIPATNTPGAKAAKVGEFMKVMVTDCYTGKQQTAFMNGLKSLQEACKKVTGKSFLNCTPAQRHDFLVGLEKEAKEYNKKRDDTDKIRKEEHDKANSKLPWNQQKEFENSPSHYYTMMKQLTLLGFFTSKTGMTETLRHLPVPGKYNGAMPYIKGEKAWAE
ncbi:MAG TPA: gluconate 2-dehydrogenase subunit 3 family protein [Chitinophagaceae bacterium]|nr:gluconate 2-dehydrogenase subunit 3 family protein [Chitinophagaceae bacterium]